MSVFNDSAFDQHERVVFCNDRDSGLRAIIAVHNSTLGPAVGGCRMYPYASGEEALHDVLRLSRGMTYKSALAGLPFGGGKSVILGDPRRDKSPALLHAMGDFVNSLNGRYVAAEDSGIGVKDIRLMSEHTRWVSGLVDNGHGGDPSPSTAFGVYLGIRTAVRHRLASDELKGISVAIQGLGNVGYHLARHLTAEGAIVYGADVDSGNLERARQALGVIPVSCDDVLGLAVDVLAPCAMGAILNSASIANIRAGIICGAANNQLAGSQDGVELMGRGVLYCPDFVVNAGGIIDVYHQQQGSANSTKRQHIQRIVGTLSSLLTRSDREQLPTQRIAEEMAAEMLSALRQPGGDAMQLVV
jgi:leucine dehydrogenase